MVKVAVVKGHLVTADLHSRRNREEKEFFEKIPLSLYLPPHFLICKVLKIREARILRKRITSFT